MKMHLSEILGIDIDGHADIDFVDANIYTDTKLFIDPCLIESGQDDFSKKAFDTISSYFDKLYRLYRYTNQGGAIYRHFLHLGERNEARFGYGTGRNGKAKTPEGMMKTLSGLHELINSGISMTKPIDIPLLMPRFDKDCMTDMLINILYKDLVEFTLAQCELFNIPTSSVWTSNYYWDVQTDSWQVYNGPCLRIEGQEILMIPKCIVRTEYYYSPENYFMKMIASRIQDEKSVYLNGRKFPPRKKDILSEEVLFHGSLNNSIRFHTIRNPNYLEDYHNNMYSAYRSRSLSDEELDLIVYRRTFLIA